MSEKRFKTVYEEGTIHGAKEIVDTKTGVHYLIWNEGTTSITPLLGPDGTVVIDNDKANI